MSRIHKRRKGFIQSVSIFLIVFAFLVTNVACAQKELITKKHNSDFYRIPKLLPDGPMDENPTFIFYGDSRPGWRDHEKFVHKRNWLTWKMLIFPFYEIYWLGNGAVGGINRLRHEPDYGHKERLMVRDAIYDEAKRSKVDFIIHGGDMSADGRRSSYWEQFIEENKIDKPLVSEFPFLPVVGNHERTDDKEYGLPNYEAIFEYPPFYTLDFPDAAIFVLDSNLIIDQYQAIDDDEQDALFEKWFVSSNPDQPSWLEQELASRSQRFKIIVMHHPPVSVAKHYTDWNKPLWGRDLHEKRRRLISLFHKHNVPLILASHDHLYQRSTVKRSNHEGSSIQIVVSGGGGAPLRGTSKDKRVAECCEFYESEGLNVALIRQMEIYHYCLVSIESDKITVKVLETTGDSKEPLRIADEILIGDLNE